MNKANSSEGFSPGFCEYLVPGFAGKKIIMLRLASILVGILLLVLLFQLLSFIPQVFAVWFVLICAFEVMVFRFSKREFEYSVAMGEMSVDVIYGKKWRKKLITVRVADADRIFPVDSFKDFQIERLGADRVIFAAPRKSEYMYCLYTKADGGKNSKTAIVFSSCPKLNGAIKFYNRSALTERK